MGICNTPSALAIAIRLLQRMALIFCDQPTVPIEISRSKADFTINDEPHRSTNTGARSTRTFVIVNHCGNQSSGTSATYR